MSEKDAYDRTESYFKRLWNAEPDVEKARKALLGWGRWCLIISVVGAGIIGAITVLTDAPWKDAKSMLALLLTVLVAFAVTGVLGVSAGKRIEDDLAAGVRLGRLAVVCAFVTVSGWTIAHLIVKWLFGPEMILTPVSVLFRLMIVAGASLPTAVGLRYLRRLGQQGSG